MVLPMPETSALVQALHVHQESARRDKPSILAAKKRKCLQQIEAALDELLSPAGDAVAEQPEKGVTEKCGKRRKTSAPP